MRRKLLVGSLLGLVTTALAASVLARLGWLALAIPRPEGPTLWTASRASGLVAFVALSLDAILGLSISTGLGDRVFARGSNVALHRFLSSASLALVAMHVVLLIGDPFIGFDAIDAVVPFVTDYRPLAVGMGSLAAYGAFVLHASFDARARIGAAAWKKLHRLSFLVYVLALGHGLFAGSDTGKGLVPWLYLASASAVGLLALRRFASPEGDRSSPRTPSTAAK